MSQTPEAAPTKSPTPAPEPAASAANTDAAASSTARQSVRGLSYQNGTQALRPGAETTSAPPVMRDGQRNPESTVRPAAPVPAVTGEVTVNAAGTDVANRALAAMATGTPIERNTRARVVAGTHRLAYLEDLTVDPNSTTLLRGWGYDSTQYTVKLNPWTRAQMIVQNNAAGFATGTNIVGSRAQSEAFWRTTLLCHEVNHIIHGDESAAANSIERYRGEFRAYWVAGFHTVANLDDRARQIKAHLLRDYPALNARYTAEAAFRALVDAHTRPAATDNLDNHV